MNHISDLRTTLGDVIAAVRSGDIDIEQAKAIKGLADSVIDSAKVEVDFCRMTGVQTNTGFISDVQTVPGARIEQHRPANGVVRQTTHAPGVTRTVNKAL